MFQRIASGNGVFVTGAAASNTGSGIVDVGQVIAPAALSGHDYRIQFGVTAGTTTYQVIDATTSAPVAAPAASGNPYASGTAIDFDGMRVSISGAPAAGDTFTVAPASRQSVFAAIEHAAGLLAKPTNGAAGRAQASGGVVAALSNIDQAIDHVLVVRASVGARQNEIASLASASASADIAGQARLSDLQDTDYAKALSDLAKQQAVLSAAQQSFAKISGRSLFDYL